MTLKGVKVGDLLQYSRVAAWIAKVELITEDGQYLFAYQMSPICKYKIRIKDGADVTFRSPGGHWAFYKKTKKK